MTAADRLAEIEARANAASLAPWELSGDVVHDRDYLHVCRPVRRNNADFIAAAREDVPWLVDLARKQQNALDAVLALVDSRHDGPYHDGPSYIETYMIRDAIEGALR